jgi:HEAT repeat protein
MLLYLAFVTLFTATADQRAPQRQPPRDAAPATRSGPADTSALASAWTALAAGRHEEAVTLADRLLEREPWNHPAVLVKLRGLAAGRGPVMALDSYEQWLVAPRGGRGQEDIYLLDPVIIGVLTELGRDGRVGIRAQALARLAASGVTSARTELDSLKSEGPAVDAALASLGDKQAQARLQTTSRSEGDQRVAVEALGQQGPSGAPLLLDLLGTSKDSATQAAAAAALGNLGVPEAVEPLKEALTAQNPFVRSSAAVALARLNDPAGLEYVQRMMTSDIPDLQLMAAKVWNGKPGPWVDTVRPLLQNQNGLIRLEAARLMAPLEPDAARQVLQDSLADQNPVVRAHSARIVENLSRDGVQVATIADLRARLRDSDPETRLHAASTLLRLARPPK